MNKLISIIEDYKLLIFNEPYERIIKEMLCDLKNLLLLESNNIDSNNYILETFYNINHNNNDIINELNELEYKLSDNSVITEGIISGISKAISKMKSGFNNKHDKIVERDKKWLTNNKKSILSINFEEVELEVLSDYNVTFEQLLNRHNIFDKIFVNSENYKDLDSKLNRFTDKKDDLKNGLDNYFRTGSSKKEIGLRKVSGKDAKLVIENMIAYCESFISGKKFLEEKLNKILIEVNDSKIEENFNPISILREAIEDDSDINDDIENEDNVEEEPKENKRNIKDRQIGIAVLLTVAEERYFDYINILKGLVN